MSASGGGASSSSCHGGAKGVYYSVLPWLSFRWSRAGAAADGGRGNRPDDTKSGEPGAVQGLGSGFRV